ncbi:MAG: ABC transporter ATP-binding protein [Methanocorpusculum sp.]|nr:ABC transporter ATP-binding protein [Methanocorpusculum sp.]MDD2470316.1 ABC transporter ATP-binding protein [Methanocorpusculum sp.]MDD4132431.1 ABC transporter ATP-binding protein [Methanocorpusculum sp.]
MTEDIISVRGTAKSYGKKEVVHPLNFSVKRGEILAVIGPSGAGKSTLLRMLDTIEPASKGEIFLFGEKVTKHSAHRLRNRLGMLFQKTVLFDRTVEENIALGLSYRFVSREETKKRVTEVLENMGMSEYAHRSSRTLSGGEGQRVSFARVLVTKPEILFLDEPTANLDPVATRVLEEMILHENRVNKTTIIINTHDQTQGQRLADRVAVMMNGSFVQFGSSDEVFYHPVNEAAAKFVGVQNIFTGIVRNGSAVSGGVVFGPAPHFPDGIIQIMLRAEDISLSKTGVPEGRISVQGRVVSAERSGAFLNVLVDAGCIFSVNCPFRQTGDTYVPGEIVQIAWRIDAVHLTRSA